MGGDDDEEEKKKKMKKKKKNCSICWQTMMTIREWKIKYNKLTNDDERK